MKTKLYTIAMIACALVAMISQLFLQDQPDPRALPMSSMPHVIITGFATNADGTTNYGKFTWTEIPWDAVATGVHSIAIGFGAVAITKGEE